MLAARSWAAPPGDAALGFSPLGKHTSPRREHPQPANSALLPLRDGGGDGARYVCFRGEPDIAGDVGPSGKNTGPRREPPQPRAAARNPGFYDFRRQGATLDAALDLVPLSHFCTSAKNCWNSPSSSGGGPPRPFAQRSTA